MDRAEMLRRVAAAHFAWCDAHADSVPYVAADAHPGPNGTDYPVHAADVSAPAEVDDPFNRQVAALIGELDGGRTTTR